MNSANATRNKDGTLNLLHMLVYEGVFDLLFNYRKKRQLHLVIATRE